MQTKAFLMSWLRPGSGWLCLDHRISQVRSKTSFARLSTTVTQQRKSLVVLGTGWSSYSVIKTIDKKLFDLIVVSPRNHFLFTPLLASTTVGTLEFRSIIEPVRNTSFREPGHFHFSFTTGLDTTKQEVFCKSVIKPDLEYSISYDKLVIGVGALTNTFGVPGVEEHAFFLKEIADARRIRNRIVNNYELAVQTNTDHLERGRLLHIVIVGGGPTGVEFGAELYDFIEEDVSRLYQKLKGQAKVTLVESNKILSSFDGRLQSYAEKKLKQREGFEMIRSSVVEVTKDSVKLKNGTVIPCGLVVWSTGLAPRAFTTALNFPKNKNGQILTDKFFRVKDEPSGSIFAIGDCADIEDMTLPCTAQVAEREGRYLGKFLNSGCDEKECGPFRFSSMGMLTYIGHYHAITETPQVKFKGITSWLVWRSAYLTRLGSWRLRMQVPLDWLKTVLFGRDISRLE
ncbi:(Zinc transporter zip1-like [Plakobranchus ocellatus]|uniref:(Zinc transporter zip1-like) n=1 Tax=Plakobranchus ocellatus TaxID=259542 RepID=A0AAV4AM15_9GAST|nr:(Zinc transporter zip1-like [Plakobranchus ocellatus]